MERKSYGKSQYINPYDVRKEMPFVKGFKGSQT